MEKLNSEELTKKVQEVKESKTHRLGGGKLKERALNFMANVLKHTNGDEQFAGGMGGFVGFVGGWVGTGLLLPELDAVAFPPIVMVTTSLGIAAGLKVQELVESAEYSLREKAKALAEKRKASEVKEEVSANAPAEKASETPSKPKASKSQADKAMQTLMKNKQLARV